MKQFEFADFVDEFSVDFTHFEPAGEGHYVPNGKWIKGVENSRTMQGIILPLSEDDKRYVPNGTYTERDRKIYTKEALNIDGRIEYNGRKYTLQRFKDYTAYADVFIYIARGQG